jgi:hypothetical protein
MTANPATHLCLVSAQATPNLTPVLDRALRPRRVILLVSPAMERRAEWLEAVLRRYSVRTDRWPIGDPWDLEHVQTRVLELLEAERASGEAQRIALNATGGTKPMSSAKRGRCVGEVGAHAQRVLMGYRRICGSGVTNVRPCSIAWQIRSRSKGSR